MIKFLCPNGHPLSAPANRVGKSGQCPRCQARFIVPAPDPQPDAAAPMSTDRADPHATGQPRGVREAADETFMFLCPNGHKLYGSLDMQGRPGQCPHCQSRFLVPAAGTASSDGEPGADATGPQLFPALSDAGDPHTLWDTSKPAPGLAGEEMAPFWSDQESDEGAPPPAPVSCHPLEQIIRRIWTDERRASPLELTLADATVLLVESFSADLSQHEYGVFAVRNDDFTANVVVIPWDQITRVTLSGVATLPASLTPLAAPKPSQPDRLR